MGVEILKPVIEKISIDQALKNFTGEVEQEYPPYSSKPVDGKPLFQIAREGRLADIEIPKHKVNIFKIEILEEKTILKDDMLKHIKSVISSVDGDFRQEEILKDWERFMDESKISEFPIIKIFVSCGSGAYMRTIAHEIGKILGVKSLAYHIKRTKIGEYDIKSVK
jgi:tRNA pseudouridine55 synthase